jgi:hypothetical protein
VRVVGRWVGAGYGVAVERVWNDARTAYYAATQALRNRAYRPYPTLVRAGLPLTQIAASLRQLYLSSPLITEARAIAWREGAKVVELRYRTHGLISWTVDYYSDSPQVLQETPPMVLTTARAAKLLAAVESLRGDSGPAAWRIALGGPSHQRP